MNRAKENKSKNRRHCDEQKAGLCVGCRSNLNFSITWINKKIASSAILQTSPRFLAMT